MIARGVFEVIGILALAACADFEAPEPVVLPDVVVAAPTFSRDVQPIFTARCATASCHNFATHQADLTLAEGYAYDETVNVPARFRQDWKRIVPSRPDSSFLIQTLLPNPVGIHRMPLGREPLTDNQIQTIINWVQRGAVRN